MLSDWNLHEAGQEDVGTIPSYFQANLALCRPDPPFDCFDAERPIFTNSRFLPASKLEQCTVHNGLIAEGCVLQEADIENSVIGIRSRICNNVRIRNSLILGADSYETAGATLEHGSPPLGIGSDSVIANAIIDKNARIGRGVRIDNQARSKDRDGDGYFIRDYIVIVPKNGTIPDGAVI